MKRIGILTINDNDNYGNRLQNYALQEFLKKFNLNSETITNIPGLYGARAVKHIIGNYIKKLPIIKNKYCRYNLFIDFNKNIKYSKYYIDKNHINKSIGEKYDTFFIGSDQVWNPTFDRVSDIDFLAFAPKKKRNSFSASIGTDEIPDELKEYYKQNLIQMNNISVREEKAKEIIENLTGRKDIKVLLDPTMLLSAEEWDRVAKKPKQLKVSRYILTYFLGNLSEERKKEINKIARKYQCEVITLLNKNEPFYNTGPSEFLYLEKNAFLICTDSFHSSVFAIIYNRPFILFDREDNTEKMNSRIETLLKTFRLEDKLYKGKITEELIKCDYDEVNKKLIDEKKKCKEFINKTLEDK